MCSPNGACIICYESCPAPIQSGCGCRSDNGLAHIDCLHRKAVFQQSHRHDAAWVTCQTCHRPFTGIMRIALSQAWVSNALKRTVRFEVIRALSHNYSCVLSVANGALDFQFGKQLNHAIRRILRTLTNAGDDYHKYKLVFEGYLALSLSFTREYAESGTLFARVAHEMTRRYGPNHPYTIQVRCNFALSLLQQGRLALAECINRELLGALAITLGEQHSSTMVCIFNLATSLARQGKFAEAESMSRRLLETRRRVLGAEHPDTLNTISLLADATYGQYRSSVRASAYQRRRAIAQTRGSTSTSCTLCTSRLCHLHKRTTTDGWKRQCGAILALHRRVQDNRDSQWMRRKRRVACCYRNVRHRA